MDTYAKTTMARWLVLIGLASAATCALGQQFKVVELDTGPGAARVAAIDWKGRVLVDLDQETGNDSSLLCKKVGCKPLPRNGRSVAYLAMAGDGNYAGRGRYGDADWAVRRLASGGGPEKLVKGTAWGIDESGLTVGETAAGRAFYFDTELHLLPTMGKGRSIATAVTWNREVVGASTTPQGTLHATLYRIDDDVLLDLGVLPGGDTSIAHAHGDVNSAGCSNQAPGSADMKPVAFDLTFGVIGYRSDYGTGFQGCVLAMVDNWFVAGWIMRPSQSEPHAAANLSSVGWYDLNEAISPEDQAAYTLLAATGINSSMQIAVTARRHSDGATVALQLTPDF